MSQRGNLQVLRFGIFVLNYFQDILCFLSPISLLPGHYLQLVGLAEKYPLPEKAARLDEATNSDRMRLGGGIVMNCASAFTSIFTYVSAGTI